MKKEKRLRELCPAQGAGVEIGRKSPVRGSYEGRII